MVSLIVWTLLTPTKRDKLAYPILKSLADPKDVVFAEMGFGPSEDELDVAGLAKAIVEMDDERHGAEDVTHLILHKISDFWKEDAETPSSASPDELMGLLTRQVEQAQRARPSLRIRFVNELAALRIVSDRWLTNQALQEAHMESTGLAIPRTVPFGEDSTLDFPAIWKPNSACGQPGSHSMLFLAQPRATSLIAEGSEGILQEFVPHHGILYKVYVIGEHVFLDLRPSLDADKHFQAASNDPQPFNSDFTNALPRPSSESCEAAMQRVSTHMAVIQEASRRISNHLGLSLFGWDLIIGEDTRAYIIDLNYFPKFEGVPDLHSHLLRLLLSL